VPIIVRNNCIFATLGTRHSVWMTVWYAVWNETSSVSPDDWHIVARNMERKEINILRKIVHQVSFIYKIIQGCTAAQYKYRFQIINRLMILPLNVIH
jgi:hypothetical protein